MKLNSVELLSSFAFKINLRRYNEGSTGSSPEAEVIAVVADPYGLHTLRTPTPPPPMKPFPCTPGTGGDAGAMPPKTPKSTAGRRAGAYTRPLFSSTLAVSHTKCTLHTPSFPLVSLEHPLKSP